MLRGPLPAHGAPFNQSTLASDPRTRMWAELLADGTFSAATLQRIPTSFEINPQWVALLQQSLSRGNETWLHHLQQGTWW